MENLIQQRDELIRQITFLNKRQSELTQSCSESGQVLAQITADIDKARATRVELLNNLRETLDEIKSAQESILSLIDEIEN